MCGWEMRFEERDGEFGAVTLALALIFLKKGIGGALQVYGLFAYLEVRY